MNRKILPMKHIWIAAVVFWISGVNGMSETRSPDSGPIDPQDGSGMIIGKTGPGNFAGTIPFHPRFERYFMNTYGMDLEEAGPAEDRDPTRRCLLSGQITLGWFPDINSREFSVGYGREEISAGAQLLYGLGMILLQMTAFELDRTINDRPSY